MVDLMWFARALFCDWRLTSAIRRAGGQLAGPEPPPCHSYSARCSYSGIACSGVLDGYMSARFELGVMPFRVISRCQLCNSIVFLTNNTSSAIRLDSNG